MATRLTREPPYHTVPVNHREPLPESGWYPTDYGFE